jgi:hypothetical protein
MMYENVFMNIGLDGMAKVDANFVMRNLGDKEETMDVYFPLFSKSGPEVNSGCEMPDNYDWITDLAVWVWDKPQSVRINWLESPNYRRMSPDEPEKIRAACWGVFPVVFPPGLSVPIEVKYTTWTYGYILTTGAGWNGTIGQADITFRLPYDAVRGQNLDSCYSGPCTVKGRDIQWQFMDFEPTENLGIGIVKPDLWWQILTDVNNLKLNPKDKSALKRLALAYERSVLRNHGGRGYPDDNRANQWRYQTSVETFRKAILLNEGDFELHHQFASLICTHAAWDFSNVDDDPAWTAAWVECVQQIKQSLALNPENEDALYLARSYAEFGSGPFMPKITVITTKEGRFDYPILTITPTFRPIFTATFTPGPLSVAKTATPIPLPTIQQIWPTDTATPSKNTSTPTISPTLTIPSTSTPTPPISETRSDSSWVWVFVPIAAILAWVVLRKRTR